MLLWLNDPENEYDIIGFAALSAEIIT